MFELKDKVVLITGATGGIGGAIAEQMKKAGATVVITGRNLEKLSSFDDSFIKIQSDLYVLLLHPEKLILQYSYYHPLSAYLVATSLAFIPLMAPPRSSETSANFIGSL